MDRKITENSWVLRRPTCAGAKAGTYNKKDKEPLCKCGMRFSQFAESAPHFAEFMGMRSAETGLPPRLPGSKSLRPGRRVRRKGRMDGIAKISGKHGGSGALWRRSPFGRPRRARGPRHSPVCEAHQATAPFLVVASLAASEFRARNQHIPKSVIAYFLFIHILYTGYSRFFPQCGEKLWIIILCNNGNQPLGPSGPPRSRW